MEKLRGLRRGSVVSAGVYSPDCEANGEREQQRGETFISSAWETEESSFSLLLLMWSHATRHPLGSHPPRGRGEGEGDENSPTRPQKDKEKTGAYLSVELSR